jgi:hypothetical protein
MLEEKAVAVMMANLKGSKKKPSNLLEFAKACRMLHNKWGIKKMSEFFNVSEYQLRQIDKINDLNLDVQKLVKEGKLGIEAAYQLWRLSGRRQSEAAEAVLGMTAYEVRSFVHLLKTKPNISVKECTKLFSKTSRSKINLLVLPLTSQTYNRLRQIASKSRKNVHDLVLKILEDYLNEHQKR